MNAATDFDDAAAATGGVDVDATRGFLAFASAGSTDVGFSAGFSADFAGVALRPRGAGFVDLDRAGSP